MPHIELINHQRTVSIPSSRVKRAAAKAASFLRLPHEDVVIVFAGEKRMRRINRQFLNHDRVTDVITFEHGDILICPMVALRNAKHFGEKIEDEIVLYVIHGLLHLAGYKDKQPQDILRMRAMEQKLMARV